MIGRWLRAGQPAQWVECLSNMHDWHSGIQLYSRTLELEVGESEVHCLLQIKFKDSLGYMKTCFKTTTAKGR